MLDNYESLEPGYANNTKQRKNDRRALYEHRYNQEAGEPLASNIGTIWGITAASAMYLRA